VVDEQEEAFCAVYNVLLRAAYRAAFRLLGDRSASEDVAGEALVRAYAKWSSVSDHAQAWVITVATNLALDVGRRRRHLADGPLILVEAEVVDPQVELRLDLQRALRELPRRQREVVVLRYLGDLSEQAVAEALGIDVGTVKSHASRGLARLRTQTERV
jgi:RNA polymerase sigma-70 factor (sigma-E family)